MPVRLLKYFLLTVSMLLLAAACKKKEEAPPPRQEVDYVLLKDTFRICSEYVTEGKADSADTDFDRKYDLFSSGLNYSTHSYSHYDHTLRTAVGLMAVKNDNSCEKMVNWFYSGDTLRVSSFQKAASSARLAMFDGPVGNGIYCSARNYPVRNNCFIGLMKVSGGDTLLAWVNVYFDEHLPIIKLRKFRKFKAETSEVLP